MKNVSYDHLKVLGCKVFLNVPKDERSKLDVKTRQCIFVSYGQEEFGYCFFDPVEKKLLEVVMVRSLKTKHLKILTKLEKLILRPTRA